MSCSARELTTDQRAAAEQFRRLKVGALFMEMGTGKTQTAVEIVNSIDGLDLLLWVCPCRTKDNLRSELAKCGSRHEAAIVGIESISQSDRIYLDTLHLVQRHRCVCIVMDESIKIKNMRALRTRRMIEISNYSEYRLILNGSPITRNICDIYAQMRFLSPKILPMTWLRYRDMYCSYKQYKSNGRTYKTVITGYANVDHLVSLIKPYVYQCSLHLPIEKNYRINRWEMTEEEWRAYDDLKEKLLTEAAYRAFMNGYPEPYILGVFQELHHSYCCAGDKFRALAEELEGVEDRTVIFCRFIKSETEILRRHPGVHVLTYGKGSFGLNLQAYNRVIYFDKTWDYAYREQSEARTYRMGQTSDCTYVDITGNPGLEKLMDNCISQKTTLVSYFKQCGAEAVLKELKEADDVAHRAASGQDQGGE